MNFIWTAIYFSLPVVFANAAPVYCKSYLKFLAKPVDGDKMWRSKPILGSHKTWRGFIVGTITAIFIVWLQSLLYQYETFRLVSYIDYKNEGIVLVGFLMGFGSLFGDSVKSFIKRRVNVKPGAKFFPWDQLDSLFGAGLFFYIIKPISWEMWLFYVGFALVVHPLSNILGYKLGFKEVPW